MKKFLSLLFAFAMLATVAHSQQQLTRNKTLQQPALQPQPQTGLEDLPAIPLSQSPSSLLQKNLTPEELVGQTTYDLQTNSAVQNRLHNYGDGVLSATWTFGAEPGAPNRGSAYNTRTADGWGEAPTARLETELRTGWPSLTVADDGTEVILCHASPAPFKLHVLRNSPTSGGRFVESDIPSETPAGLLWPRSAASGQTIHAIAITTPVGGLGGELVNGINGALLYFRSPDAGLTWDVVDAPITGIDSTFYGFISADSYDIHARGDVVVIAVGTNWGDIAIVRSEDGGNTWEKTIVRDFPVDDYTADKGYTLEDIGGFDGNPFDSLAISTADGAINVTLDNDNLAHVVFGEMYVLDNDLSDGNTSFFPGTSGLSYWNENMDSTRLIYDAVDVNGNDTLDVLGVPSSYGTSITSHPSMGVDADNNLYLALGAMLEDFNNEDAALGYRHVVVMTSTDGGMTFNEPLDIVTEEASFAEDIFFAVEGTFPSVAKHVDNQMHLTYQLDFLPGHSVGGNADHDPTDNFIVYQAIDRADIPGAEVSNVETVATTDFAFELSPNPANGRTQVTYTLKEKAPVQIRVTDMLGKEVKRFNYSNRASGLYNLNLQTTGLEAGIYLIQLQVGQQLATQKLVVK
ncbi:MAG: T9SS type A sorting domain-containing protein [Saprospiraceae bacterium]